MEIFSLQRVLPTTPKMLKGTPQTNSIASSKSPMVMNDIDNILGKRGLRFTEGAGHNVQRGCYRRLFCM